MIRAFLVLLLGGAAVLGAQDRPTVPADVWPLEVTLSGPGAFHSILSPAALVSADPAIARVDGSRVVAVADGATTVSTAGAIVTVTVRDMPKPRSLDFANVIMPALTRTGCNAAGCHGAALGQGGFKLSLFGTDPEADYLAMTHEYSGRRIDRADPAMSLLFRKPTKQLPHKGGKLFDTDSDTYKTLLEWAGRGFPAREDDLRITRLEAKGSPREESRGSSKLLVRARYSDGIARDVTHLANYASNDDAIAEVDATGTVAVKGRGETSIMIRFAGHVVAVKVGRPFTTAAIPKPAARTFVDEDVNRTLERLGLEPSPECDDAMFHRRAFLDIIGTLPSVEEVRAFLAKPDRDALIDRLIARPEFDTYWGYRLGQLFALNSEKLDANGFYAWLRGRVRAPWNETAQAMLTGSGFTPESNFYRMTAEPKEMMENAGRIFLGTRWTCAQCHNHPFERFRQTDYYGLAAMFARVRFNKDGVVSYSRGEVVHPKTARDAAPMFPDGTPGDIDGDRRTKMAAWIAGQPQLGRALANRVWAFMMGRGLVHPVDDFRASNPPSHPELLDALGGLKTIPDMVRAVAGSAAWRRGGPTEKNRDDLRACSHALPKLLSAEALVDAIAKATGVPDDYAGRPAGVRAVELGDVSIPSYTLDVCGRNRPDFGGNLTQQLHLLNGDAIQSKLGAVKALLLLDDSALVEDLMLRTLSRPPTKHEREHWMRALKRGPRPEIAEDLFWALLNSKEFQSCN